ncbi:MAG: acyl-CoA dehydrogenase family protein [Fimbriimonadaceae bacterium]|nr:acyl-CoA dehydrogenase family protein [Fimbriimonadaceae bacterium]QYK55478.1 MAG: acyl-CoA dehydrogenase family protein [Fimbriimonadaceae bacterium]
MSATSTENKEQGCSFFSRTPDRTFIPEDFSSDEKLMVQQAEQFSRKEVLPLADRLDRQEDGLMPQLVAKAGALGFCGVDTDDAFGGLGLGKNLAARIIEFLSLNGSFSVTFGVTSGIAQLGLSLFGTDEQKQKYLPHLATGEWIGAYALSEPNSGSDALSMATRAERRGDKWVLNGTKMWISNAKWAQFFLVMAKIDGEQVSAFLVERDMPGVSVSREEHKLGLKGSSTARLLLENAEVPLENLLHEAGKGHKVALNALNIGRFKLAAMSLGPARDAIYESSQYAKDRKQFGRAIAEFGLVRQKFADMAALYFGAESALYRLGANLDQAFEEHGGTVEGNQRAAEEFAVECSAVKVLATEAEAKIVDEALQVYGGYGFTEEFPLARIYRDCRVSRIYEGTNEINRIFLADRMKRRADEGRASLDGVADSFVSELAHRAFGRFDKEQVVSGALSDLVMLAYAEQSARLRAARLGGIAQAAHDRFANWANVQAAAAYQVVTGEAVTLPKPNPGHVDELAAHVLESRSPV